MIFQRTPRDTEVHPRIDPKDVDVTQYDALINKFIRGYAKSYGPIITDNYEDFYSAGVIGLLKAKAAYDPTRGTFVTIAFRKVFTEIHNLFVKYSKEYSRRDLRTAEQLEGSEASTLDMDRAEQWCGGSSVDYEAIGRLLTGTNLKLYWCLYRGLNKSKCCAMADIPYAEYDEAVSKLKEEVLEITSIMYGG